MSLKYSESNLVANKVLAILKGYFRGSKVEGEIRSYCNGREQGWSIIVFEEGVHSQVSFAQNRRSDDIVVYYGKFPGDFENNIPTDECYKRSKTFFPPDKYQDAATFIAQFFDVA